MENRFLSEVAFSSGSLQVPSSEKREEAMYLALLEAGINPQTIANSLRKLLDDKSPYIRLRAIKLCFDIYGIYKPAQPFIQINVEERQKMRLAMEQLDMPALIEYAESEGITISAEDKERLVGG